MFALDTAVILDYWGRGPGEMVTRVKGHEGLASLISLLMAVTHLQPLDHRVQRLRLGMGWSGGVSVVHKMPPCSHSSLSKLASVTKT